MTTFGAGEPKSESGPYRSGEANRVRGNAARRSHGGTSSPEGVEIAIPGMTKRHRREGNLAAVAVELSAYDLREIDEAPSQITITAAIECPSLSDLRPRA
jgi:hypothetical protein